MLNPFIIAGLVLSAIGLLQEVSDDPKKSIVKGPKGEPGAAGKAGEEGKTGPKGAAGAAGKDGKTSKIDKGSDG